MSTLNKFNKPSLPRGKRPRVQVSLVDKERAIARIRNGATKAGVSRELGVPESTVRGWVKRAEMRKLREATEQQEAETKLHILSPPLQQQQQQEQQQQLEQQQEQQQPLPTKQNHNGIALLAPVSLPSPAIPAPLPQTTFQQAAESQLEVFGWLQIFNAGILNFALIANAAYMQASARGDLDRLPLWQIISDYVDEAGRIVCENGGIYVCPPAQKPRAPAQNHRAPIVYPPMHITAEDDEPELDSSKA